MKYGYEENVQALLDQYNNYVIRNEIIQEFNRAFNDMQNVVIEYKRDGNIGNLYFQIWETSQLDFNLKKKKITDKTESSNVDRFLRDVEERWKTVSVELYCAQSMLEEVVAYWKRWKSLSAELENWIDASRYKLNASEDEKLEYFQVIAFSSWDYFF